MEREPVARPAADYAEAVARFEALRHRDGAHVTAQAVSRFWAHGAATPLGVVLFHGFTNCPEQWSLFAAQLHAAGHTVIVPRFPGHGGTNRLGPGLARVAAHAYLETATEAVDIARGAAHRVVVAGLSSGGALAGWIGVRRSDVARAICMSSLFGLAPLGSPLANAALAAALRTFPNATLPWDPFGDGSQIPAHGYPVFSTRALGALLGIGARVARSATQTALAVASAVVISNRRDPAVSGVASDRIAAAWNARRPGSAERYVFDDLPVNHDIVDPTNPLARLDLVYPVLRAYVEGETSAVV